MKRRAVLLAGASLLAMTSHAHALTALGSLVISSMLSVGLGGLLPVASAAAIGAGALSLALSAVQIGSMFLFKKPSIDPQAIKTTSKGSEGPGRYATGRVELGARMGFGNTAGYDIFRLLLHCFGPIAAVEEYFYDGREITVEANGEVSSPPWAKPNGSWLNVKTKLGTGSETAWPDLISHFPTLWTANHRVRGIGQTLLHAVNPGTAHEKFLRLYQGGIKELRLRARVGLFYDPRTASTAWTINGVLQCLHWFRMLPGITDSAIDFDDIGLVATQGEALVPTATGPEPRCQMSGGWEGPLTSDIVMDMLESCGLEVRTTATGKYTFAFIEDDPANELTLYSQHIIDIYPQAGPEGAKRPNKCTLRYFSPERRYEMAEVDLSNAPWARVEAEIDKYGELEFPVDLVFCCDASQAQRIARRLFHMARADFGVVKTKFSGLAEWGGRIVTLEIPDVGEIFDGGEDGASVFVKALTGPVRANDEEGTCEIPFQIIPDILKSPWNPATDEVLAPPVLQALQYESELPMPAAPSAASVVQYPGGAYETRVKFAAVSGGTIAEAVYRTYTVGEPNAFSSMTEYNGAGSSRYAYDAANTVGSRLDAKCRFFNSEDEGSYYSDLLTVASMAINNSKPAAPTLDVTVDDNGTSFAFTVKVSTTSMNVVQLKLQRFNQIGGTWSDVATGLGRPEQAVEYSFEEFSETSDKTVSLRAYAYSSNSTASNAATFDYIIPGTGG